MAVRFLYIPLGIAVNVTCYGFTDKAKLSLKDHSLRRLLLRIEPLSESRCHCLSPSAVHVLSFPHMHAHEQAYMLGSFINTPLAQSFARLRFPLL